MTIVDNISEINKKLLLFHGSYFKVFSYNISLRKIIIRLEFDATNSKQIVYVYVLGCKSINGSLEFSNNNLTLKRDKEKFILEDKPNNFRLISKGGVTLAIGFPTEFAHQDNKND